MRFEAAEAVARAALYEGYLLYPYRASAIKNRRRWSFGVLHPRGLADGSSGERWRALARCPLRAGGDAQLTVEARFLQVSIPENGARAEELHRAVERRVTLTLSAAELSVPATMPFTLHAETELIDGVVHDRPAVCGELEVSMERLDGPARRLSAVLSNLSQGKAGEPRTSRALLAAHLLLGVEGGAFGSLLDPPDDLRAAAAGCASEALWPVLIGGAREAGVVLASPVILYDDPKVAPESAGDLFDATEIDEILSLRVLTLSDAEKAEIRAGDPRAKALLERTEALTPEQWSRLHGAARKP